MTEKELQYLWNNQIFKSVNFKDTEGNPIEILDFGKWNHNSGADFLEAKIKYKNLIFAGNIELHLKSSDWVAHHHSNDKAYDNVILHAVYQHDKNIETLQQRSVPTLELKPYIDEKYFSNKILNTDFPIKTCNKTFKSTPIPRSFLEKLLIEKLNKKSETIELQLIQYKNDYEAVLFHTLAYSFGLKINAEIFQNIAQSVPFSVIRKIQQNPLQLEALFFGKSGWLDTPQDQETQIWQKEFRFIQSKFGIDNFTFSPKFLRLRPPNFPTIRLSQLANLIHIFPSLFSKIIEAKDANDIQNLFTSVRASKYWEEHFTFGKKSAKIQPKPLSKDFINLLIINTIFPIKYTYLKNKQKNAIEEIIQDFSQIPPENNAIIKELSHFHIQFSSALDTQAFIHFYHHYHNPKKCLHCDIVHQISNHERTDIH